MFTSITGATGYEAETTERVPSSSFPWIWVGFVYAGFFFIVEVALVIAGTEESVITGIATFLVLLGVIYWLVCVHRLHKILEQMTNGRYPISPGEAAGKHFIPFYNLYWIFKWPGEFSDYINRKGRVSMIPGAAIGAMLLLATLCRIILDGAIGLAFLFGVTLYISSRLKAHVKALRGLTPDQLPPLPDPRIFSQPIETSTSPAQETVGGSSAG